MVDSQNILQGGTWEYTFTQARECELLVTGENHDGEIAVTKGRTPPCSFLSSCVL